MVVGFKRAIKSFVPVDIWRFIRLRKIEAVHNNCKNNLDYLVNDIHIELLDEIKPKKVFDDKSLLVWQYWSQGFSSPAMPDIVKICLKSVEDHIGDYTLVRLSDDNLYDYVEMPKWLQCKVSKMSKAHFSDLLRCLIISLYGGLWLDASVFLTGDIPSYIFKSSFFIYRRDPLADNKQYWEDTFAYYFNWSPSFMVRSLIGIMYAKKGNGVVSDFASMLLAYWRDFDYTIDYFFFQILMELYFIKHPETLPEIMSDTVPHLLRQYINNFPAPGYSLDDILHKTTLHSLNYKNCHSGEILLSLFPEYKKWIYLDL